MTNVNIGEITATTQDTAVARLERVGNDIQQELARLDSLAGLARYLAVAHEDAESDLGRTFFSLANGVEAIHANLAALQGQLDQARRDLVPVARNGDMRASS